MTIKRLFIGAFLLLFTCGSGLYILYGKYIANSFNVFWPKDFRTTSRYLPVCFKDVYLGMTYEKFKSLYPEAQFGPYSGTIVKCNGNDSLSVVFNFNTDELSDDGEKEPKGHSRLTKIEMGIKSLVLNDFSYFPDGFLFYENENFEEIPYHGFAIRKTSDAIIILRPTESRYGDRGIEFTIHYPIKDEFEINYLNLKKYRQASQEHRDKIIMFVKSQIVDTTTANNPFCINPCLKGISNLLRPDSKYAIGSDVANGQCIARVWFNDTTDMAKYKDKRSAFSLPIDKEIIYSTECEEIEIRIEYGIIQLPINSGKN